MKEMIFISDIKSGIYYIENQINNKNILDNQIIVKIDGVDILVN